MKKAKGFCLKVMLPLVILGCALVSCNKDDDNNAATQADAADMVEATVIENSNGFAKLATDANADASAQRIYTTTPAINCGQQYSVTYNPFYTGAYYTYNYTGTRTYTLQCTDGIPTTLLYTSNIAGTYTTPTIQSNDTSAASLSISNLGAQNATAVINGTYNRNGYQESRVRQRRSFNSVIALTLQNIVVNKTTSKIMGGTAVVSVTGTGSQGASFSYNGTITFNGDNTATLVINGTTYTINLQ